LSTAVSIKDRSQTDASSNFHFKLDSNEKYLKNIKRKGKEEAE
jgi:hypothetical protein